MDLDLCVDSTQAVADLALLQEAADRLPALRRELIAAMDRPFELRLVACDGDQLRMELPAHLADLAAQTRAGRFDA